MNSSHVTLSVERGILDLKEYVLGGPSRCVIGRARDLRFPHSQIPLAAIILPFTPFRMRPSSSIDLRFFCLKA